MGRHRPPFFVLQHVTRLEIHYAVNMISAKQQQGFTLTELITVIIILGFIAIAIIPRFVQPGNFESRTASDVLISSIRQAQQLAMSKATSANVTVTTDNAAKRIRISYNESGVQNIDVEISSNITITSTSISFRKSGEAVLGSQAIINITPTARNVCIETTGYAHAC